MTPDQREWIDNASYEQLLQKCRYAPVGDTMFVGDTSSHFMATMARRKEEVGPTEAAATSKRVRR